MVPVNHDPTPEELAVLPKASIDDVTILYDSDSYDGPLSGMLEWNGERLWFNCFDMAGPERKYIRQYAIFRLSPDSTAWEAERQAKWVELVKEKGRGDGRTFWEIYPPADAEPLVGDLVAWFEW